MLDQKILDAFQTMWGPFPEPVMLILKDRTILAVNDLARSVGTPTGVKCFSLNPEARTTTCKQCKANLALHEERTVCTEETQNGKRNHRLLDAAQGGEGRVRSLRRRLCRGYGHAARSASIDHEACESIIGCRT